MNRNRKATRTMALAMAGVFALNAGMEHVSAAGMTKEETVYVKSSPSGEIQEVIVSDWLKNEDGKEVLSDKTDLTDIKNVKGDETFSMNGDTIQWNADGKDIYYQGSSTKELPVSMEITYYLDGKEIQPEELAGKSGHVKMVYQYRNHSKDGNVYTPFALLTGMILPVEHFSNVRVSNGKAISDGEKNIVIGVGLPGLQDSLKIEDSDLLDEWDLDLDIPDGFEVEADVTDFSLTMSMTVAAPLNMDNLELDQIDEEEEIRDKVKELADAATQLVDGSGELADGVQELKDGCTDLLNGMEQLDNGANQLNDGIQTLNSKKKDLIDGVKQLADGLDQMNRKKESLVDGAEKLAAGSAAVDQGAGTLKDGMDQLAEGINTLDQNRPALMTGLQSLMNGMNQLEEKKPALTEGGERLVTGIQAADENLVLLENGSKQVTEGLKALLGDQLKGGFQSVINGIDTMYSKVYAANHTIENVQGSGSVSAFTTGVKDYVNGVNSLLASINNRQEETEISDSQIPETTSIPIDMNVNVSFADANAQAVEALKSSIEGNEAVLASLLDVKSQKSSLPDEIVKQFSNAYNTYSGQLDNCIAQLESDIAGQKAALAALQEKQEVSVTKEMEIQTDQLMSMQSGEEEKNTMDVSDQIQNLQTSGAALQKGADDLNNTMGVLEQSLKALYDGANQIYCAFYGTEAEKGALDQLAEGSGQVTDGIDTMEKIFSSQMIPGTISLSSGVKVLFEQGIDVITAGMQQLSLKLPVLNDGIRGLSDGAVMLQDGMNSLKKGTSDLADGSKELKKGTKTLASGVVQLADGGKKLNAGSAELADGIGRLADGSAELTDGTSELKKGGKDLDEGTGKLLDGAEELQDGMEEFDEKAIQKIVDFTDGDLKEMLDRLLEIRDASEEYRFFTDSPDHVDGSVKFIMETTSIE